MTARLSKTQRIMQDALRLVLILAVLAASGCGLVEQVVDPPPDYYYCFGSYFPASVAPGEVVVITIADGGCLFPSNHPWAKATRLGISEGKPFIVTVLRADEGVTVTPTGVTQSNEIRVSVDVSVAAKPWLLSSGQYGADVGVRLMNPRAESRGWSTVYSVKVYMPTLPTSPVKQPEVSLWAPDEGFGTVKVGSEVSKTIFIYNKGTEDVAVAGVSVGSCAAPCPFQVGGGLGAGSTISKGSSRKVTVIFRPTAPGPRSATLVVQPSQGPGAAVNLSGNGQ